MGPIPTGKDFVTKVEDFFHKAFYFPPTIGYLSCREDSNPEILEIVESLTTLGGIAVGVFGLISGNPFLAALFFP